MIFSFRSGDLTSIIVVGASTPIDEGAFHTFAYHRLQYASDPIFLHVINESGTHGVSSAALSAWMIQVGGIGQPNGIPAVSDA